MSADDPSLCEEFVEGRSVVGESLRLIGIEFGEGKQVGIGVV